MIFEVDPGSNTSEKATLLSWAPFLPTSVLGSNDGYEATAQQVAGLDVLDDDGAGRRLGLLDPLRQRVLGVPLQARVDREGARRCRRPPAPASSAPTGMTCRRGPARRSACPGVPSRCVLHHQLDPAAGLAVAGHVADEGGRRAALRVGALGAGLAAVAVDAGDPELGDGVPRQRRDVAAEDAVAAGAGELGHELGDGGVEQRAPAWSPPAARPPRTSPGRTVFSSVP